MAKKIIIDFTAQPIPGSLVVAVPGIEYGIFIGGQSIVYNSGWETVVVQFVPYGTVGYNTQFVVELQPTLTQTIDAVMELLNRRFTHPNIIYSIVGDTIEVLFNVQEYSVVNLGASNANIIQTAMTVPNYELLNLKYFFQYKNIVNDEYICRIYKKNYSGLATEIHGKAIIDKSPVKDHLDPIRGTGISLELESSLSVTLEDLYTESEQDFMVNLYKNNKVIFRGFLNPEGVYQSFVRDEWIISLGCVDGLGALSNLSFVDPVGFPFTGKMKAIDIVYYCLLRSGIQMPVNVSINTFYDGLVVDDATEILNKISMNADRFQKTDNDTLMSCEEVLRSVLDVFCAVITQQDGQWYIFKPNELYNNANVVFKQYDIDNVYLGNITIKTQKVLGSQIDNIYPHHCGGNQQIQIKGSISKYRINYKYGFITDLLENGSLLHDNLLNYEGWTIDPAGGTHLINDPLDNSGFKTTPQIGGSSYMLLATSESVALDAGNSIEFNVTMSANGSSDEFSGFVFRVRNGTHYLKTDGTWTTDSGILNSYILVLVTGGIDSFNYSLKSSELPNTANTFIEVYVPYTLSGFSTNIAEINKLRMVNTFTGGNIIGEFHTVQRQIRVSSNVKPVKTIFNGDNAGILYLGAIYKEDEITPTSTWSRKGRFESFSILRIAAEEELRISQKPLKIFKGSIYGQLPYLSVVEIQNVGAKFMFIEYSYDTMTNIMTATLLELYAPELTDIDYKYTFDFGQTVKPTITS